VAVRQTHAQSLNRLLLPSYRVLRVFVRHFGLADPKGVGAQLHPEIARDDRDRASDGALKQQAAREQLFTGVGYAPEAQTVKRTPPGSRRNPGVDRRRAGVAS